MLVKSLKTVIAIAISSALFLAWGDAQQQQPQTQQQQPGWKDRAEYDLYVSITKETDPKKALGLLNTWKEKYPNSDLKQERLGLYLSTYQKLGDAKNMMQTAKELLAANPKDSRGLYAATSLTPFLNVTAPDALEFGEKAARGFLASLNELFAPDKKPANVTEEAWKKERAAYESLGHRTLGWIAMVRKNHLEAEAELTADLKLNSNDAEAAYWLGSVLIAEKKPERVSDALFYIARAACYTGPGAVVEQNRKAIEAYLNKTYTSYHGQDPAGLQQLCSLAKTQVFPPPDFRILSQAEIAAHKEEVLARENPQLAFWLKLKDALTAPNGEQYFEGGMKGALVPPEGVPPLKGKLIRQEPARNPKELVLALSDPNTPEVILKVDPPMTGRAEPGTDLEFRGVPTAFTKEPFLVTFEAEKKSISGWPAPPPPTRKTPGRRVVPKKK